MKENNLKMMICCAFGTIWIFESGDDLQRMLHSLISKRIKRKRGNPKSVTISKENCFIKQVFFNCFEYKITRSENLVDEDGQQTKATHIFNKSYDEINIWSSNAKIKFTKSDIWWRTVWKLEQKQFNGIAWRTNCGLYFDEEESGIHLVDRCICADELR